MSIANKALIYSIFIFPGAGCFLLKHNRLAYSFAVLSLGLLIVLMYDAVVKATRLADKLVNEITHKGYLEPQELLQVIPELPAYIRAEFPNVEGLLSQTMSTYLMLMMAGVWLAGIVLTYYYAVFLPNRKAKEL